MDLRKFLFTGKGKRGRGNESDTNVNASKEHQQSTLPRWLKCLFFVVVTGILALFIARLPSLALFTVVALILILLLVRLIYKPGRPTFSLRTILLLTGLVACGIVLSMTGGHWKLVHRFGGFGPNIAMSADGKLVAASQGTSIEIRDIESGRMVQTIEIAPTEAVKMGTNQTWTYQMRFTENGKSLMSNSWQSYPCLFDVASGNEIRGWPKVGGGAIAKTGSRFVANSIGGSIPSSTCLVFDVEFDEPILTIESDYPFCRSISPTGSHVLVGKDDSTAELWCVDERRLLGTVPWPRPYNPLSFAKFSQDSKFLAVPTATGLAVWNVAQCRQVAEWKPPRFNQTRSLEWSPDSNRLVASYIELIGPSGPPALAAAMAGNAPRNAIEHSFLLDQNCNEIGRMHGSSPTFSPTGDRIATVYGGVLIYDGKTSEFLSAINSRPREMVIDLPSILYTPDGDWLYHNNAPSIFRRMRSEYWYSIYQLPAFWGMIFFLSAILLNLFEAFYVASVFGRRSRRSSPSDKSA